MYLDKGLRFSDKRFLRHSTSQTNKITRKNVRARAKLNELRFELTCLVRERLFLVPELEETAWRENIFNKCRRGRRSRERLFFGFGKKRIFLTESKVLKNVGPNVFQGRLR